MRLLAFILSGGESSQVKHFTGLSSALTGGKDTRQEMERACFLVIEETSEGIFLYRYGVQGKFAGDTWHFKIDEAKDQASYEYGEFVQEWADVPPEVEDVVVFGLNRLASVQ